jgi:hypothetical protein
MPQIVAKFIFKLPFSIMRKKEYGSQPQHIKTSSEEIIVYPPAEYGHSLFKEPLWSPDPEKSIGEVNDEPVWEVNCIPIHIRRDFPTIPITSEEQEALVTIARDVLYRLLTLYRWRGEQLQVSVTNIEGLSYDLRYFNSANELMYAGPSGASGQSSLHVKLMPREIIEWDNICQDLISGVAPELYESLLLDAWSVVSQEPRRAILDAATACEVFIKNFCYGASQSNPELDPVVYTALTPRGTPLLSYFHEVLKYLFKYSFQEDEQALYKELDCLIRTNNCVKHEGLLQYKDDKGKIIKVDSHRAREFISTVEETIRISRSLGGEP